MNYNKSIYILTLPIIFVFKKYLLTLQTKFQTYMKSIKLSLVLFAILATVFVGCKQEEDESLKNPTISFASDGADYYVADAEVDSNATVKVKIIAQKGSEGR
ncbi:MAG: hypothetical protein KatS3mg035_1285 [Bacteroidia bacterium]|nr:MAG: hypothetical protein KatS3mg035_1285 [Bacteroidia bacterium]